jgi:peptidoglycan/xylan/chitin deacetylase (PgdA/CDA1 family)
MCAITFDDGWKETYEVVFPILKKLNCPATVFIPTSLVGKNNPYWFDSLANLADAAAAINRDRLFLEHFRGLVPEWRGVELTGENLNNLIWLMKKLPAEILFDEIERGFEAIGIQRGNGKSIVNWDDIKEMRRSNIHFDSHGMRHYILPTLKADLKREEIFGSLEMLRKIGPADKRVFCYPNGDWDDESIRLLVDAGYDGAVTTRLGLNNEKTNLFLLNRVGLHEAISNTPSLFWFRIFQAYLSGRRKGWP